jgi:hypothetical protein
MSKFLFSYRIPSDYAPGSGDVTAAWATWFEQLGETGTLGYSAGDSRLGGYTLVKADDLDAAVAMAERCPGLQIGAGIA